MGYGVRVKVWGEYASFNRPEMKVERVSYDVLTPSAARGILEAIYWKPAIRWIIDYITVLKMIKFENIRRNERLNAKISQQKAKSAYQGKKVEGLYQITGQDNVAQRSALVLKDVAYVIEAHFEMTSFSSIEDTEEKHYNIAVRRIRKGQYFHHPYFGCREFPVQFAWAEETELSCYQNTEHDLGYMLWDLDFADDVTPIFFRPLMKDGRIEVPDLKKGGGIR